MWRSFKETAFKSKIHNRLIHRHYSNEASSKSGKVAFIVAATGAGLASAVVYSKYDPKLKNIFEKNVPYIEEIYKMLPDTNEPKDPVPKVSSDDKKEFALPAGLLQKKLEKADMESQKSSIEFKSQESHVKSSGSEAKLVLPNDVAKTLDSSEAKIKSVKSEAKTAAEYLELVNKSKEEFQKELEIVLPKYTRGIDKTITESDLNLLIAHAYRTIEQLQNKLAGQQASEKDKIDEAVRECRKMKDDDTTEAKIEAELEKKNVDLEAAIARRVASLKENFETELRKQLHRQIAAHTDHIQEVLKVQEKELDRKHSLDLEEKLLYQKGLFITEVSGAMARLKGILAFLKAKAAFDVESKKAQSLWLACQSLSEKISSEAGNLRPLEKDIEAIKKSADERNVFVNTVLSGIQSEAVRRGVHSPKVLKQRFSDVKKACQKVAMIDEKNDSLYRYFLSCLQSYLIFDEVSIPKAELQGKIAVDPNEWDTYDILSRVSYSLRTDNLEQALRYANQLKGEPRAVAKDWVKELRLFLETQVAVTALLAHAAAIGVQAYD